ncbi:MAG: hypothetical protein ABII18_12995 [bacterium]
MLRISFFTFIFLIICVQASAANPITEDCTFNGKKLYGKVKIVDNFPDIKVEVTKSFPDLKVKTKEHFASKCGEWIFVKNFADFKVKFVESFPDIKIQFVDNFPGRK